MQYFACESLNSRSSFFYTSITEGNREWRTREERWELTASSGRSHSDKSSYFSLFPSTFQGLLHWTLVLRGMIQVVLSQYLFMCACTILVEMIGTPKFEVQNFRITSEINANEPIS